MKKIIFGFLQFVLFLLVLLIVPFWAPLGARWLVTHPSPTTTRYFTPDGLLLAIALYIAILVIDLLRRRLASSGLITTIALLLALILSYIGQFGFVTRDIF